MAAGAHATLSTGAALAHHFHEPAKGHDDGNERNGAVEGAEHPSIRTHVRLVHADDCRDAGDEEDERDETTDNLTEAATGPAFAAAGATRTAGHK